METSSDSEPLFHARSAVLTKRLIAVVDSDPKHFDRKRKVRRYIAEDSDVDDFDFSPQTDNHDDPDRDDEDDDLDIAKAHSVLFNSASAEFRHSQFRKMNLIPEKNIVVSQFEKYGALKFVMSAGLFPTVSGLNSYSEKAVVEFYANLTKSVRNVDSHRFNRVFCRNRVCEFSPDLINSVYGTTGSAVMVDDDEDLDVVASVITDKKLMKWPQSGISHEDLTVASYCLLKIGRHNWTPNAEQQPRLTPMEARFIFRIVLGHPVDFGIHAYRIIMEFAERPDDSGRLPFPSLIWSILSKNDVFLRGDSVEKPCVLEVCYPISNRRVEPSVVASNLPAFLEQRISFLDGRLKSLQEQVSVLKDEKAYLRNVLESMGTRKGEMQKLDDDEELDCR